MKHVLKIVAFLVLCGSISKGIYAQDFQSDSEMDQRRDEDELDDVGYYNPAMEDEAGAMEFDNKDIRIQMEDATTDASYTDTDSVSNALSVKSGQYNSAYEADLEEYDSPDDRFSQRRNTVVFQAGTDLLKRGKAQLNGKESGGMKRSLSALQLWIPNRHPSYQNFPQRRWSWAGSLKYPKEKNHTPRSRSLHLLDSDLSDSEKGSQESLTNSQKALQVLKEDSATLMRKMTIVEDVRIPLNLWRLQTLASYVKTNINNEVGAQ